MTEPKPADVASVEIDRGGIEVGIFDHLDRGTGSLSEFFKSRLKLTEAYDALGFRAYHLAEHHSTPLGMSPSPSVFLASIAQRTRNLRFGPLVYILPLYHPLRLLEEICMLDQLSDGRLELGIGRGISPIELACYGLDPSEAQARYKEVLDLLLHGFGARELNFAGGFYRFEGVPIELEPKQKPHPPLWYGIVNPEGAVWTAANRVNVVSNQSAETMRTFVARYCDVWKNLGRTGEPLPKMGISRHVVIAPTDGEALASARRAYRVWRQSFMHLWVKHGRQPITVSFPEQFDEAMSEGLGAAGSARTVGDFLSSQMRTSGANYLVCRFAFGDLSLTEILRSVELFARDVMPTIRGAGRT